MSSERSKARRKNVVMHILQRVFSRVTFVALAIVMQLVVLYIAMRELNRFEYFYAANLVLTAFFVLLIVGKDTNPSYKIAWLIPIMTFPVFGILLYVVFGRNRLGERTQRRMQPIAQQMARATAHMSDQTEALAQVSREAELMSRYIRRASGTPVFHKTASTFLSCGEAYFTHLIAEMQKAQRFIFIEYYIIEEGLLWDSIHALLIDKVKQGVEVRVLFDDFGTMFRLPDGYERRLERENIRAQVFNRLSPALSGRFNNRDHRKIVVIDGVVGFTGGVNIADRYVNAGGYGGHWLDCGVMLRGEAVHALTVMFLSLWDYCRGVEEAFDAYAPDPALLADVISDGFVQPFTDSPLDDEPSGKTVYRNLINRAKRYVYINTPYLVIDSELMNALTTAAKCGVDVRIVTPARADNHLVQAMSRSYYEPLVEAGVRVYEYRPGMVHAKTFVCDDLYGVVGTINLDYRSLYLHFECAVWLYGTASVGAMQRAYFEELASCEEVTLDMCKKRSRFRRLWHALLRTISPLF